jgi:hypothetical protein
MANKLRITEESSCWVVVAMEQSFRFRQFVKRSVMLGQLTQRLLLDHQKDGVNQFDILGQII